MVPDFQKYIAQHQLVSREFSNIMEIDKLYTLEKTINFACNLQF